MEPPWKSLSVIVVTAFFFDLAAAGVVAEPPRSWPAPASSASEGLEEGGKGLWVALERRLGNFYAAALCTSTIFDGLRLRVRVSFNFDEILGISGHKYHVD